TCDDKVDDVQVLYLPAELLGGLEALVVHEEVPGLFREINAQRHLVPASGLALETGVRIVLNHELPVTDTPVGPGVVPAPGVFPEVAFKSAAGRDLEIILHLEPPCLRLR